MYSFALDLEHHSNSEHSRCVSHKVFFWDVVHSYMTYLLEKIVRPYDGWPRSSRLRKVNVVNHWPDDQEFLYFLKFRSIYRYNVHESDLEVSGVQFDLKRFIIWYIGNIILPRRIDTVCFFEHSRGSLTWLGLFFNLGQHVICWLGFLFRPFIPKMIFIFWFLPFLAFTRINLCASSHILWIISYGQYYMAHVTFWYL